MSVFSKTRAAAGYAALHARSELARAHAATLLARLDACEDFLPGDDSDVPAVHGLLRDLVLAARDLAGPAWLEAASDDPDIAAFTALQATRPRPAPAELDEISAGASSRLPAGLSPMGDIGGAGGLTGKKPHGAVAAADDRASWKATMRTTSAASS